MNKKQVDEMKEKNERERDKDTEKNQADQKD